MKTDLLMGPCIVTRYLGPTDTKGSRIVATHKRDSETTWRKVISWDHSLDSSENHQAAAQALLHSWPYGTDLEIVARGHDNEAYFWFCHSRAVAEAGAARIISAILAKAEA